MATPELPAWIEPAANSPKARHVMSVAVTTDVGQRFVYEAIFTSTFDAYDDALERFQTAARIEVKAMGAPRKRDRSRPAPGQPVNSIFNLAAQPAATQEQST